MKTILPEKPEKLPELPQHPNARVPRTPAKVRAALMTLPPKARRSRVVRTTTGRVDTVAAIGGRRCTPVVYFIQAQLLGLIKIGSTVDLDDRLRTLQTGSPDRLEIIGAISSPDAFVLEERFHECFAADREHGEWFRPSPELLAHIAQWPVDRLFDGEREKLCAVIG